MKKKFLTALIGATIAIQSLGFSVMNVNAAVTTAPKSNTSTTTSTTVAPNPVVTTTKDVNEIDFDGTIFIENYEWSHWLGEELNLDDMKLQIAIMNKNGYYDRISDLFSYESGKFSDYYTIDTSEVDVNTPGDYKIYIESKKDAVISVNTYGNGNLPAGTYNIRLNGDKSYKNVKISESTRPTPPSMLFLNDKVNIPDKKTDSLWLSLVTDTNITAVSADPTIAEIVDVEMTEDYTYAYNVPVTHGFIKVKGLKAGETTTITAIDGKGNKASCEVYVEYTDESYPEGTMYFYSPTNCIDVYVNSIEAAFLRGYEFNGFYEIGESPITYSIDDKNIAELAEIQGDLVNIKGVSAGNTVLRAEAPDGRTASVNIHVEEPVITTTNAIQTSATATNTTTSTTVVSEEFGFKDDEGCYIGDTIDTYIGLLELELSGTTDNESIEYSLSDESIAEITHVEGNKLVIELIEEGRTILTAKSSNGNTASVIITVNHGLEADVIGDFNFDGVFTISDIVALQLYLTGKGTTNGCNIYAADMNHDSKVNVFDLIIMKRYLVNKIF